RERDPDALALEQVGARVVGRKAGGNALERVPRLDFEALLRQGVEALRQLGAGLVVGDELAVARDLSRWQMPVAGAGVVLDTEMDVERGRRPLLLATLQRDHRRRTGLERALVLREAGVAVDAEEFGRLELEAFVLLLDRTIEVGDQVLHRPLGEGLVLALVRLEPDAILLLRQQPEEAYLASVESGECHTDRCNPLDEHQRSAVRIQARNRGSNMKIDVNGKVREVDASEDMPLLWVLRDLLGLTGTKFGCGMSQCGCCTVHLDGAAVRSCTLPISAVAGKKVTTIEGLSSDGTHPVQQAWAAIDVVQCGYCQP